MRRLHAQIRFLPILAALAACSPEPSPDPSPPAPARPTAPEAAPVAIPDRFRGEWNADLSACGTGLNDSRLVIGDRQVRFYESTGVVTAVELPAPDRLRVTLALTGEGEAWSAAHEFALSADATTLTDASGGFVRQRCP